MNKIPDDLPPLVPELLNWLNNQKLKPAGPPFFNYLSMNKENEMLAEVGVPILNFHKGDERIKGKIFPEGKYASVIHFGHYSELYWVHVFLENWIKENALQELSTQDDLQTIWHNGRCEFYHTENEDEIPPEKWKTVVVFSLKSM